MSEPIMVPMMTDITDAQKKAFCRFVGRTPVAQELSERENIAAVTAVREITDWLRTQEQLPATPAELADFIEHSLISTQATE